MGFLFRVYCLGFTSGIRGFFLYQQKYNIPLFETLLFPILHFFVKRDFASFLSFCRFTSKFRAKNELFYIKYRNRVVIKRLVFNNVERC